MVTDCGVNGEGSDTRSHSGPSPEQAPQAWDHAHMSFQAVNLQAIPECHHPASRSALLGSGASPGC
ncbi:hypothetical protein E2C01_003888 [Portunus trituberculatus]|uniref:Uncharacterized protein n=1 Tax=Portunus trituberculatus TaxID=210409 RepID=A0A5B7CNF3_PORTR|nr:hypothetical protein [Portunus trituberculatus]